MNLEYNYFPLFVNMQGKKILFVGAGEIAAKRMETLLKFGPCITVLSPGITDKIEQLVQEDRVQHIKAEYSKKYLKGFDLVLTMTNEKRVNSQVVEDCKKVHIPVNNASDKSQCDFYFPAIIEHDGLVFGVTSDGQNYGKVRQVCDKIRTFLSDGLNERYRE